MLATSSPIVSSYTFRIACSPASVISLVPIPAKFLVNFGVVSNFLNSSNVPLPKKYQDPFRGTKPTTADIIPVKIREKTNDEVKREKEKDDQEQQIKKAKDDKFIKQQQVDMKEKQQKEYNRITFEKQQRLVHWCNGHDQGNYRSIHSDEYKSKTEKKYEYY